MTQSTAPPSFSPTDRLAARHLLRDTGMGWSDVGECRNWLGRSIARTVAANDAPSPAFVYAFLVLDRWVRVQNAVLVAGRAVGAESAA